MKGMHSGVYRFLRGESTEAESSLRFRPQMVRYSVSTSCTVSREKHGSCIDERMELGGFAAVTDALPRHLRVMYISIERTAP